MNLDLLTAISPIDGRYRGKTKSLANYFSEYALIRYRVRVEIEYFITLCELPLPQLASFDHALFERLRDIYRNFGENEAQRVKDIEKVTNHDVKAVEYFIKEEFDKIGGLEAFKEFIHFGLTSQDINNTSVPLSVKEALEDVFYPQVEELIAQLQTYADEWKNVPMLAKTHGQPASPTRLGKEIMVFVYRLMEQLNSLKSCRVTAKFGGATGNYNAHHVAYPQFDWRAFGNKFVSEKLGLEREQYTTQISNYDYLGAIFDAIRRINTIIIDLDRDFWMYISMDYFKQKIKAGEVVTELGTKILRTDEVKFHGTPVTLEKKVYVLLNKPKDYVTTSDDPQQRKTVMDLVKGVCLERIYPVGRLDRNTTGVLLLTNDGDLASKLTHPKFLKKKVYHVHLDKNLTAHDMEQIREGITLEDGEIKADAVEYADERDKAQVGIEIHSGKNRIVRRIFESLGYRVTKLDRVQFAGLTKKNLRRGDWRFLTEKEVDMLRMGAFE